MVERGKIDSSKTQIHDRSLSLLGTGIYIKSGVVNLVLLAQTSPLYQATENLTSIARKCRQFTLLFTRNTRMLLFFICVTFKVCFSPFI